MYEHTVYVLSLILYIVMYSTCNINMFMPCGKSGGVW